MRNMLAVGAKMLQWRINSGVICIGYGRDENVIHRFCRCSYSIQFWMLLMEVFDAPLPQTAEDRFTRTHAQLAP